MFILCIDDEPIRYRELSKIFSDDNHHFLFTCRFEDVQEYLILYGHKIAAVLLDHDMPGHGGVFFAHILKEKNFPVICVSTNPSGAANIAAILTDYEVPCTLLPVGSMNWQSNMEHIIGQYILAKQTSDKA